VETPWHRARHHKSEAQEKRLGNKPNSKRQPNSGRGRFAKRDGRLFGHYLVEARQTDAKSYTIKEDEFRDIEKQARLAPPGCRPAMALEIGKLRLIVTLESDWDDDQARLL